MRQGHLLLGPILTLLSLGKKEAGCFQPSNLLFGGLLDSVGGGRRSLSSTTRRWTSLEVAEFKVAACNGKEHILSSGPPNSVVARIPPQVFAEAWGDKEPGHL